MRAGLGVGHLQNPLRPQAKSPWPLKAQETHLRFPAVTGPIPSGSSSTAYADTGVPASFAGRASSEEQLLSAR